MTITRPARRTHVRRRRGMFLCRYRRLIDGDVLKKIVMNDSEELYSTEAHQLRPPCKLILYTKDPVDNLKWAEFDVSSNQLAPGSFFLRRLVVKMSHVGMEGSIN